MTLLLRFLGFLNCMRTFCLGLFFSMTAAFVYGLDVPSLSDPVNDLAGSLSREASFRINQKLRDLDHTSGSQIAVLIIPSLEGENIEEYSIRVVEKWKLGQKGKDNGVLFLVSVQDRKLRIEVGRGLEGAITDLVAGRLIDRIARPNLRRGDFDGAIEQVVDALIQLVKGEFPDSLKQGSRQTGPNLRSNSLLFFLLFCGFGLVVPTVISIFLGAILFAIAGYALGFSPLIFAIIGAIVLPILRLFLLASGWRGSFGGGGGSGGGWSSGGGGFSGGGGGFGGGGASGDW